MHWFSRSFNNNNNNNNVCCQLCGSKNQVMKSTGSITCIREACGSNFLPGYGLSSLKLTVLSAVLPGKCRYSIILRPRPLLLHHALKNIKTENSYTKSKISIILLNSHKNRNFLGIKKVRQYGAYRVTHFRPLLKKAIHVNPLHVDVSNILLSRE